MVTVAIIGAGIDGLGIGREIGRRHPDSDIFIFEKNNRPGMETTEHNSGVIHAGIYYPEGSLKDLFCAQGNASLMAYCTKRGIPHKVTGKYVVAKDASQISQLEKIVANALRHGISTSILTQNEVRTGSIGNPAEPHVKCYAAAYIPTTGIVDTVSLVQNIESDFVRGRKGHSELLVNTSVDEIFGNGPYTLAISEPSGSDIMKANVVINAAGLAATEIAAEAGFPNYHSQLRFVQGPYWRIPNPKIQTLVYPIPTEHSLGIHYTIDLQGDAKLGPGVVQLFARSIQDLPIGSYITANDSEQRREFYEAASAYIDGLREGDLRPDMAGIRPQQNLPKSERDFVIVDEHAKGKPGFVNCLFNESPGLTCVFPRASYVADLIEKYF